MKYLNFAYLRNQSAIKPLNNLLHIFISPHLFTCILPKQFVNIYFNSLIYTHLFVH